MKIGQYDTHPAADVFPLMSDADLAALADSIEANGLDEPIVLHGELVLDGRNRLIACERKGVEPRFLRPDLTEAEAIALVQRRNLHRRSLTRDQRALAVRRLARLAALSAKPKRQRSLPAVNDTDAMVDAVDKHPVLADAVSRGDLELHVAATLTTLTQEQQEQVIAKLGEPAPDEPVRAQQEHDEVTWTLTQRDVLALQALAKTAENRSAPELKHAVYVIRSRA